MAVDDALNLAVNITPIRVKFVCMPIHEGVVVIFEVHIDLTGPHMYEQFAGIMCVSVLLLLLLL